MQADDPPCLSVGTAVSAKYKGAFCEAKVSNAVHVVKCKIAFKNGLGTYTVNDDHIKGTLRIGQVVQARHPEKRDYLEATVMKIQDCSQYTVVFDDGDITTLRRSALCLKSGRHFNESETLDQLPLTHPEHFGNPVVGGRRGRRNRQLKEDSSEEEAEEENELDLDYSADIGRVVCIETTDKKRSKDNWFPGLVVIPSAQPTVRINVKDEYLVRSFKDGRYYTVPKKEVTEFTREMSQKVESTSLSDAVHKAQKYQNNGDLPAHWERSTLFNLQTLDSDSDDNYSDSLDDEPSEEKDFFVAQLYKFMEEARTPLNSSPTIAKRDVDLHRLYRIVEKLGGYNRVTNQNKWKTVTSRMRLPSNQSTWNQVQNVYKTYLSSFQSFYRTLGVTMTEKTRSTKKNRGRSLIRDKDRATPVNSPKPEKEEEILEKTEEKPVQEETPRKKVDTKKEDDKKKKEIESDANTSNAQEPSESSVVSSDTGRSKRSDSKVVKDKKAKATTSTTSNKSQSTSGESSEEQPKVQEKIQQTRSKSQAPKIVKEIVKDIPKDPPKESPKEPPTSDKKKDIKIAASETKQAQKIMPKKVVEDEKKRGRKRPASDDKNSNPESPETSTNIHVNIGDKLIVYYGPSIEAKMTYEAKVIDIKDSSYLVHYTGWNTRYDEWIVPENIAMNMSAKNSKQMKPGQNMPANAKGPPPKVAARRGRGTSISSKGTGPENPRSTTPSSVTSSSSRTKSPATPATRSAGRLTRQDSTKHSRRASSAQTELSDSDTEESESEVEIVRTRSVSKSEENTGPSSKKKATKTTPVKNDKRKVEDTDEETDKPKPKPRGRRILEEEAVKEDEPESPKKSKQVKKEEVSIKEVEGDTAKSANISKKDEDVEIELLEPVDITIKIEDDEDTEKEDDSDCKPLDTIKSEDDDTERESEVEKTTPTIKRLKRSAEKVIDVSDEDSTNLPKGRDFDLNQIRLELKGLKVPALDSLEKDVMSSDDSVNLQLPEKTSTEEDNDEDFFLEEEEEEEIIKVEIKIEEPIISVSSEDIYEFKEPEPFEFETTRKLVEEKGSKKRIPRLFDEVEKSPKKTARSPRSTDGKDSPSPGGGDKKRLRKTSKRLAEDSDDDEIIKKFDPFDKLIESPSYNLVKSGMNQGSPNQQQIVAQQKAVEKILEEPLFSENIDVYRTERLDLSDNELLFTRGDELFGDSYLKSPDRNLELDFCKEEPKNKESDEEDSLRESIQRVIAQTTLTDEDSNDTFQINPPSVSYQPKKKESETITSMASSSILSFCKTKIEESKPETSEITMNKEPEKSPKQSPLKHIKPAFQETDSSVLESIVAQPPLLVTSTTDAAAKDLNLKTGCTKIADSILQKLMKINSDSRSPTHNTEDEENTEIADIKEIKIDNIKEELKMKPTTPQLLENIRLEDKIDSSKLLLKTKKTTSLFARSPSHIAAAAKSPVYSTMKSPSRSPRALKSPSPVTITSTVKTLKPASPISGTPILKASTSTVKTSKPILSSSYGPEVKKRRKVISRQYIEDSDSDSSDSEQLVIAKSDDDSQTNIMNVKSDTRGSCGDMSPPQDSMTDESQSQEATRSFKFDLMRKDESSSDNINMKTSDEKSQEAESVKEEDHDPHLHNLLLCEETIPRSPAPSTDGGVSDTKSKNKSVLEMPFASAPASSNNKNILLSSSNDEPVSKGETPNIMMSPENRDRETCSSSAALDNSPPASPATPESPMMMSPRERAISPSESFKSNGGESSYSRQRRNSSKISLFSEEDTQMTGDGSYSKKRDDEIQGPCRKRRKSSRSDDIPAKRGRKPLNRSSHNSDSDDSSEDRSVNGSTSVPATYKRSSQTPRPTRYNFTVEFDASVDSSERISIIMQKLNDLRKTYADVKSELAAVERRRKRLRRREREGKSY